MTELQAINEGFTLWQDGWGWWASDGRRQLGPCKTKVRLLGDLERKLEAQALGDRLLQPETAVEQAVAMNPGRAKVQDDQPMLCVHCHKIHPHDTVFDGRGRCPDCMAGHSQFANGERR